MNKNYIHIVKSNVMIDRKMSEYIAAHPGTVARRYQLLNVAILEMKNKDVHRFMSESTYKTYQKGRRGQFIVISEADNE